MLSVKSRVAGESDSDSDALVDDELEISSKPSKSAQKGGVSFSQSFYRSLHQSFLIDVRHCICPAFPGLVGKIEINQEKKK